MTITVHKGTAQEVESDLFIVGCFEGEKKYSGGLAMADKTMDGMLRVILEEEGFEAKPGQTIVVHTHGRFAAKRVLVVGLGEKKKLKAETIRRMAGSAAAVIRSVRAKSVSASFDGLISARLDAATAAQAWTEGVLLGSYQFLKYKGEERKKNEQHGVQSATLVASDARQVRAMQKGVTAGEQYAQATMLVRDLVNEPAVHMTPKMFADAAMVLGQLPGVSVKVYEEAAIRKLKMGSFLSVAAGSDQPPYFVHLTYKPKKKNAKKVALCGKGITFDTGGLSIKPTPYMNNMKNDMAGAALILGVFSALPFVQPGVEVHGVLAVTENMPSGKATKPGDVVTAYNGKTIEVMDTDAEGRLVLADALSWAEKTLKPDFMIDYATLTGAAIVALGQEVAALMGTNTALIKQYITASTVAGESTWELPLVDEYRPLLNSTVADIGNISTTRWAGTIIGGLFLRDFVQSTPWLHIDIAGPAWAEKQVLPYVPLGATGFGVRSTLNLLQTLR